MSKNFFNFLKYASLAELHAAAKQLHQEIRQAGRVRTLALDEKKERLAMLRQAMNA